VLAPMAELVDIRPLRDAYAASGTGSVVAPPARITCPHRIEIGEDVVLMPGAGLSVFEEHRGRHYEPWLRAGTGSR
jgi:hypothetical protein